MTIQYTIDRMLESHTLEIQRDEAAQDEFGGEAKAAWTTTYTIKGLFWWWHGGSGRTFRERGDPERSVLKGGGGAMIPQGTDIRAKDRVIRILKPDGAEILGPFRITSVREHRGHTELSLERP